MSLSRLLSSLFALALLLTAAGCAPKAAVAQSQVLRDPAPKVSKENLRALTDGNSAFAFDLYRNLSAGDGNLFFSPYSLSSALAMIYAGAKGQTESQMAQVLHYTLPQNDLHPAFNALDLDLNRAGAADSGSFKLKIANSLWGEQDFTFLPAFLDVLGRNYGAGLRLVDYVDAGRREQARQAINDWVKTSTEGKIPKLINQGVLTRDTRLVLANAIYFQGKWETPFASSFSWDAPFGRLDGITVTVRMMHRRADAPYAESAGYQAVALPYQGGRMEMVILLPAAGQLAAFEQSLTADKAAAIIAALQPTDVGLNMPRFNYETSLDLVDPLAAMGMPAAFDPPRADFSGATGKPELFISHVVHKAFVAVDELGTEAAAATGAVVEIQSVPKIVLADHPFIYFIRDRQTGSILFIGRVVDPS